MFVLDGSVAIAAIFPDEQSGYAMSIVARMRDQFARVPCIWMLEVCNVIVNAERRARISGFQGGEALKHILDLLVEPEPSPTREQAERIVWIARMLDLTVYDAAYVELAARYNMPLATLDQRMRFAAQQLGVTVL